MQVAQDEGLSLHKIIDFSQVVTSNKTSKYKNHSLALKRRTKEWFYYASHLNKFPVSIKGV